MTKVKQEIISYNEAEEIVRTYLKKIDNLSQYSSENNLSYQSLLSIKNNKYPKKQFTKIVYNILDELKYKPTLEVIKVINYKIKTPKQSNYERSNKKRKRQHSKSAK